MDELSDRELDAILHSWQIPDAPGHLRSAVFGQRRPWWRASLSVPVPLAVAIALLLAFAVWRWPRQVLVTKTVRVDVPIIRKEVVTRVVYRDRIAKPGSELRPVTELRLRILRSRNAD